MEKGMETSPAIFEDKVYVGGWDNKFRCLDAQNGKLIWEFELGELIPGLSGMESSPLIAQGKVYVGGFDGKLYCLDAASGEKQWDFPAGVSPIASSPVFYQDRVFVGNYHGMFYCIDSTTGEKLWEYDNDFHTIFAAPSLYAGKVYGISYTYGKPFDQGPVKIFCLDHENGELIWENYFGWGENYPEILVSFSVHASPTISHGKVFIGSWNGRVYCFDAAGGSQMWEFDTGDASCCISPILYSGKILVATNTGKLYCLDTKDPSVDGWLMFNHDLEHRGDATGWSIEGIFMQSLAIGNSKTDTLVILPGTISYGGYCFNIGADLQGKWSWTVEDKELDGSVNDLTLYIVQEVKNSFPSYELEAEDLVVVTNELKGEVKGENASNGTITIRVEGNLADNEGNPLDILYSFNGLFSGSMQ
jgi:outer membrane protein assembly factor BamB